MSQAYYYYLEEITMGRFAIINSREVLDSALRLARGCYQRDILTGYEAISGSTLTGRARNYSSRYKQSSTNLLRRCRAAGLPIREETQDHGRRVIVIG